MKSKCLQKKELCIELDTENPGISISLDKFNYCNKVNKNII